MNAFSSLTVLVCSAGIGAGMLSALVPQRRTKRIMGFVLGLFLLVTVINGIKAAVSEIHLEELLPAETVELSSDESDYVDAIVQQTADLLVEATDELLREHGIGADDIRLRLNISPSGGISVDRIDIYMSELYRSRKNDVRSIVSEHLSKEPNIYVQGQEVE